jgi:NAD(P)H dehydrogenase (quinone)
MPDGGRPIMRILVLFAHPLETSFLATLHTRIIETLRLRQHEIDDLDLYAENFNPVMSRQTYANYLDIVANRTQAAPYVERLLAAEAMVLISPVWHDGFPAILKGFFDCVFLPGVSFKIEKGHYSPMLLNIKRVGAVCTYGAKRSHTIAMGDPQRRFVKGNLGVQTSAAGRSDFIGLYDMDGATPQQRAHYLTRVTRAFSMW